MIISCGKRLMGKIMNYGTGDIVADRYQIRSIIGFDERWESYEVFALYTKLVLAPRRLLTCTKTVRLMGI